MILNPEIFEAELKIKRFDEINFNKLKAKFIANRYKIPVGVY